MATRRPQSSLARIPPPAKPHARSRSVARPPTRASDDPAQSTSTKPPPAKINATPTQSQSRPASSDSESNIQVVVRCRRRSEREVDAKSPVIVTSNGAKSSQLSIETTAPTSTLGMTTLPPTRTYPFDLVFGPEADQASIYHEVASPMLEQVLMGYNCTLFAYGQTGTGKTYTMHGDLVPSATGNPSIDAGMIPRVLFHLFHKLETSGTDFSVKISYIELYNEELRDLLAVDLAAPMGTSQPMGMSKDLGKNADGGGLKIFDDSNKRGVYIQGVEEISVKDSADALSLLTKGSHRRQTAATKFNDHSSRSHSIFTITIHTKEAGVVGEDLMKTGKLNLVDLAGSENIGRSGAQNTRAREAGMINQSLLTLGRVINALVEKASHVPYRESKLTRLLQDSLGGRTKTCIVATVSPARCNLEETLSTLDYAMHAKSIRNKPELNQRMTRSSLIKEYVSEIERLKADVLAAREKNGIFFSEETWTQMSAEQELQKTELDESKKQVDIVANQLRVVRDEFDQTIGMLKKREGELKDTRQRLEDSEEGLARKTAELGAVKRAFEEEVIFRKAFQQSEHVLDGVAVGLRNIAGESIRDVGSLFDKLERKSEVMAGNTEAVVTHGKSIASATRSLSRQLDDFAKASTASTAKLCEEADQFGSTELAALASNSKRLRTHIAQLKESLGVIHAQDGSEETALGVVRAMIRETHDTFKDGFGTWGTTLSATCTELCAKVEGAGLGAFADVEKALKLMAQVVEGALRDAFKFIEGEREAIVKVKRIAADAAGAEIKRLRQQNEVLTRMVESQRASADVRRSEFVRRFEGMLGTFVAEGEAELKGAVQMVQRENQQSEKALKQALVQEEEVLESMDAEGTSVATTMEKRNGDVKRTRDGAFKNLTAAKSSLNAELSEMETAVAGSITTYSAEIQQQTEDMSQSCSTNFEEYHRAKRIRLDATSTLGTQVQSEYTSLEDALASSSRHTEGFVDRVSALGTSMSTSLEKYEDAASSQLSSLGSSTKALSTEGTRPDTSSGSTPRKRQWKYVDEWELTGAREDILKEWRGKGLSAVGSETFIAEHLPLPDDEVEQEPEPEEGEDEDMVESEAPSMTATTVSEVSTTDSVLALPRTRGMAKAAIQNGRGKGKEVQPAVEPLVDARNVYMTRGSRRAR